MCSVLFFSSTPVPGGNCLLINDCLKQLLVIASYLCHPLQLFSDNVLSMQIFQAVFGVAEELLNTASQSPRLALHKAKAGWVLLGALMALGR